MIREPLSVGRLRPKPPSPEVILLLHHIDDLVDEVERLEAPLSLTPQEVAQAFGPATDEIGGQAAWVLGERDLPRVAAAILEAAMRARRKG